MAVLRQDDLLTGIKLCWVNAHVERLDLSNGGAVLLGQVHVEVTRGDEVGADNVALAAGADRNVDDLRHLDNIGVLDLRVDGEETREGDVEVPGDGGEGVVLDHRVGRWETGHAELGGGVHWGEARGVVDGVFAFWDVDCATGLDEVDVGDAAGFGDVANTRVLALGDSGQILASLNFVCFVGGGAAWKVFGLWRSLLA